MRTITIRLPNMEAAMLGELKKKKVDYSAVLASSIRDYFKRLQK